MKYAIFSDIHSNLEALTAVMEDMLSQDVTHTICLGDIVGYAANPKECLQIVRTIGCPVIMGNHDQMATITPSEKMGFNQSAMEGIDFTISRLNKEDIDYLRQLPLKLHVQQFTCVHDSLDDPGSWCYVTCVNTAQISFNYQRTRICFNGHTHVPRIFEKNGSVVECPQKYPFACTNSNSKYLINVGSVGQPRDGDSRASYAIFTPTEKGMGTVELRRVEYDIEKASEKILREGLPARTATRLTTAR